MACAHATGGGHDVADRRAQQVIIWDRLRGPHVGDHLGKPVRFEPVTPGWRRELIALSTADEVVNPDVAGHITEVAARVAQHGSTAAADAQAPQALIGREPMTFRGHVRLI